MNKTPAGGILAGMALAGGAALHARTQATTLRAGEA